MKTSRRSNVQRSAEMRGRLIAAARRVFVRDGFTAAATDEIVKAARVTRGALYHHFADKTDLFRAVVREEAAEVAARIGKSAPDRHAPAGELKAGARAYFEAMNEKGRCFLLLVEGPSVLGPAEMREIDEATGAGELRQGLEHLEDKDFDSQAVAALTAILSAAFDRAALDISEGAAPAPYRQAIDRLLDALA